MKDFELENIGRKMPYQVPSDRFFEDITEDIMAKVTQKQSKRYILPKSIVPLLSTAALLAVVLTVALSGASDERSVHDDYVISESVDDSVDSFLNSLSDDELSTLAANNSYYDDFYTNLPNN